MWGKWTGGVRVAVLDREDRLLMVSQMHEGREIWLLPGGAIEHDENSAQAGVREVLEETGMLVEILDLLWHVEEVSDKRGQRFVNYFAAKLISGDLALGEDPEFSRDEQVLRQVRFVSREEMQKLPNVHPPFLKDEIWDILKEYNEKNTISHNVFRKREYVRV